MKPSTFTLRCKATALYLSRVAPERASIEITSVESQAMTFRGPAAANAVARSLGGMFGQFDWQPAQVTA